VSGNKVFMACEAPAIDLFCTTSIERFAATVAILPPIRQAEPCDRLTPREQGASAP
jgi:hypothetical protein